MLKELALSYLEMNIAKGMIMIPICFKSRKVNCWARLVKIRKVMRKERNRKGQGLKNQGKLFELLC